MSKSFVCAIDGTSGTGKTTLLNNMARHYADQCVVIPESLSFIPQWDQFKDNKSSILTLADKIRKAETYRWHLVDEAKKKEVPLILLDTSIQHMIIGMPMGMISKLIVEKAPREIRHREAPEQGKTKGIKLVRPDHNIFITCSSLDIQKERLEKRGSFDQASFVPTPLYQMIYNIGYNLISPFLQKSRTTFDTAAFSPEEVFRNINSIILNESEKTENIPCKMLTSLTALRL